MNDFRCGIAKDIADDLFNTLSNQAQTIIDSIGQEQSERMVEVMQSISHCCGVDELGEDKHGDMKVKRRKIYDTTLQKALEMCETFKRFNLKNSSEIESARASLEKLLNGVTAKDIRDSDAVRHHVKEGIDDILSKFAPLNAVQ
jgi:Fic family protein